MEQLFGGSPQQNYGQASSNISNELNTAFNNNQQGVNNALSFLTQWLGKNPSPVSTWGNIAPPSMFGSGATLGGGSTNSLGQLVNAPANLNTPGALPTSGGIAGGSGWSNGIHPLSTNLTYLGSPGASPGGAPPAGSPTGPTGGGTPMRAQPPGNTLSRLLLMAHA